MGDTTPSYLVNKRQGEIFARFHIGSSTPDLPAFGAENNNGTVQKSPFNFGLQKVGTQASLITCNSSLPRNDGSKGPKMERISDKGYLLEPKNRSPQTSTNGKLNPGIYYYQRFPSSPGSPISRKSYRPNAVRKMRRRAVFKNGDCNILQSRISKRRLRYLQDIFTTLVDSQWRWTLTIFAIGFVGSWLIFALIWWLIAYTHGDLEEQHLPINQNTSDWIPCVLHISGFTSCFLFSIETQHTIGYGVRTTTEECPEAVFIMCLQSIAGMIIQAFMVGIVFAKMTRPKLRTQTLQFSKNAVICQRDGQLCLMFRVGDMRKSHIIGASIRAQLIRAKKTKEGEVLNNFQTELTVNADGCDGNLFFIWPMTIVHKIDPDSPFYHVSASDLLQERFEIVVILEGTIESTGQTTQARSSYLASEVLWGHRFEPVVYYNKDRQGYEVNYSKFDNNLAVDTPLCSGAELAEFYRIQDLPDSEKQAISSDQTSFLLKSPLASMKNSSGDAKTLNIDDDSETRPFPTDYL